MYVNHATSNRSINTLARQCEIMALKCHDLACGLNTGTCDGNFNLDIAFMNAELLDSLTTALSDLAYNLESSVEKAIRSHNEALEARKQADATRENETVEEEDYDLIPRRELSSDGSW